MTQINSGLDDLYDAIQPVNSRILSEDGIIVQINDLNQIDISTEDGRKAYAKKANEISRHIADIRAPAAKYLYQSFMLSDAYARVLEEAGLAQSQRAKPRLLLETFVVSGIIVTVWGTFSTINSAVNATEDVVGNTAAANDDGRKGVIKILKEKGVSIDDNASAEEVKKTFEAQGVSTRMTISNEVRNWVTTDFSSDHIDQTDDLLRKDKDAFVNSANVLGKVAVESSVNAMQSITGGVSNAVEALGGKQTAQIIGAATDLTLQVTETDPVSLVKKNSIVTVTGKPSSVTIPLPENKMTREETESAIKKLSEGKLPDSEMKQDVIDDIGKNVVMWHLKDCKTDIPEDKTEIKAYSPTKFLISPVTLEKSESSTESNPSFDAKITLVGNPEDWMDSDVMLSSKGMSPAEAIYHGDSSMTMHLVPLEGTISLKVEPTSPKQDDMQEFRITADLKHVYQNTDITLDATQAALLDSRTMSLGQNGEVSWKIAITEEAQITVRRTDSGESYTKVIHFMDMTSEADPEPGTEPEPVPGDVNCMTDNGDYKTEFSVDTSDGRITGTLYYSKLGDSFTVTIYNDKRTDKDGSMHDMHYVDFSGKVESTSDPGVCHLVTNVESGSSSSNEDEGFYLVIGDAVKYGGSGLNVTISETGDKKSARLSGGAREFNLYSY